MQRYAKCNTKEYITSVESVERCSDSQGGNFSTCKMWLYDTIRTKIRGTKLLDPFWNLFCFSAEQCQNCDGPQTVSVDNPMHLGKYGKIISIYPHVPSEICLHEDITSRAQPDLSGTPFWHTFQPISAYLSLTEPRSDLAILASNYPVAKLVEKIMESPNDARHLC